MHEGRILTAAILEEAGGTSPNPANWGQSGRLVMTKTTVMTKCAPVGRWKDICLLAVIFFSLCSRVSSVDVLDGLQVEETDLNKVRRDSRGGEGRGRGRWRMP